MDRLLTSRLALIPILDLQMICAVFFVPQLLWFRTLDTARV